MQKCRHLLKNQSHTANCALCIFLKEMVLFCIGGSAYILIELLWRGRSHWTMGILGGLCFVCIGLLNEFYTFQMYMEVQGVISAAIITLLEFITGCIVNIWLGWDVWDYSNMPLNVFGQICLPFTILWFFLSLGAIYLDDFLRQKLFYEKKEKYHWLFLELLHKDT